MLEDISMEDEVEESSVKATLLKGKKANEKVSISQDSGSRNVSDDEIINCNKVFCTKQKKVKAGRLWSTMWCQG